jgi:hypothetical protein
MIRARAFALAPGVARVDEAMLIEHEPREGAAVQAQDVVGLWVVGAFVGGVKLARGDGRELVRMLGLVERNGGSHAAR